MAKLAEALKEAATLADADDAAVFGRECTNLMTKIKRGLSEVRKDPPLLQQVPPSAGAWIFFLRAASEKPQLAKQVWEATVFLISSEAWAQALVGCDDKHRLHIAKAASRDAALAASVAVEVVARGVAELGDVLPTSSIEGMDPGVCTAVVEGIEAAGQSAQYPKLSEARAKEVLGSEAGLALVARATAKGTGDVSKRKIITSGGDKKAFGKDDELPVFVCEGISGSHQKMEIKKGL
eukprot:gnl/TRDRNA2_/TRDRNA2_191225_c0_seq1.p1 gnl/TRDRNA2_/TRDRNA2_191225_c0~~gnl/TRDRNA2_/TRDRNA2_191225_c0_seq1.p1  ORF type:complete len:237 (-),score=67.07 gnl/TRDRNA2_/TRDRNA2_191225_c0_seq1:25-735(-)